MLFVVVGGGGVGVCVAVVVVGGGGGAEIMGLSAWMCAYKTEHLDVVTFSGLASFSMQPLTCSWSRLLLVV